MKTYRLLARNPLQDKGTRKIVLVLCAFALALSLGFSSPRSASAGPMTPPEVPSNVQVPSGYELFRVSRAEGTQNYICLSNGWEAFGPQATLFNAGDRQVATHFLSPNPDEYGTPRPTWQDSFDTSTIWALPLAGASYQPDPTAVPWLLLGVVGSEEGPEGGDRLVGTVYVQRINTTGGLKPTGACGVGDVQLVPYTADYLFYKAASK